MAICSQVWLRKARDLEACFTSKRPQSCNHSAPELTLSLRPPILFPTSPHGSKPVRLREIGVRCVWNVVAARAKKQPHIQTAMPTIFCASGSMVTCSVHRSYSQLRRTGATRTTERNRKSVCLIVNVSCKPRATQSSSHGLIPAALYGRRRRRPW